MSDFSVKCTSKLISNCAEGVYYDDSETDLGSNNVQGVIETLASGGFGGGNQGPQGAQGPQGEDGAQGPQGPQGPSTPTYGFRLVKNGNQSLASGSTDIITDWDTNTESYNYDNTSGDFNQSTGIFTVGVGEDGFYNISGSMQMAAAGGSNPLLQILVNGSGAIGVSKAPGPGSFTQLYGSSMVRLVSGDTVYMTVTQNSGSNQDVLDGRLTHFSVQRVA